MMTKASYPNPFRLLLIIVVSIFVADVLVMFLFSLFPRFTLVQEAVLDASFLLLLTFPLLYVFFYRPFLLDIEERKKAEIEKDVTIVELRKTIDEVKVLKGFIPICAKCKKVRDDAGYWQQVETYIRDRSEVQFSHGICPTCSKELYPELEK